MQLQLLLSHNLSTSPTITPLVQSLHTRQQQCLKRPHPNPQALADYCSRDRLEYEQYIREYSEQFVGKGVDICMGELRGLPEGVGTGGGNGEIMRVRVERRRKCVNFYMKSFQVFEDNVKDKLNSLINKLQYAQL